jgi:predicted  nucleic acid-binding Zn-ribbon protein
MSYKRISISLDEYNMLHTETLAQKDTITRLQYDLADAITEQQWQRGKAEDLGKLATSLTAEVERLKAAIEAAIVDLTNNQRLQAHRKLARALSGDKHE